MRNALSVPGRRVKTSHMSDIATFKKKYVNDTTPWATFQEPKPLKFACHVGNKFSYLIDGAEVKDDKASKKRKVDEDDDDGSTPPKPGYAYCCKKWKLLPSQGSGCRRTYDPTGKTPGNPPECKP